MQGATNETEDDSDASSQDDQTISALRRVMEQCSQTSLRHHQVSAMLLATQRARQTEPGRGRETDYQMFRDYPAEIVRRRKEQMKTFKEARRNNIPAFFSLSEPDKLFIRGRLWPVGKKLIINPETVS